MNGALTLFAQDAETKLLIYSDADIQRSEADDQILEFVSFWRKVQRGVLPTLIFDSRATTYSKLWDLDQARVKFIPLRRRGVRWSTRPWPPCAGTQRTYDRSSSKATDARSRAS